LRAEANRVNSFMKSSERLQFRNARVFREGEDGGLDSKGESKCATSVLHSMASVSRAGKDDGRNIMVLGAVIPVVSRWMK